ncbi:sugar transferase [Marinilabiliaceae bacterium JC017]|nr:sugar transferase [Marinilabiliaceae bacterium JC017]
MKAKVGIYVGQRYLFAQTLSVQIGNVVMHYYANGRQLIERMTKLMHEVDFIVLECNGDDMCHFSFMRFLKANKKIRESVVILVNDSVKPEQRGKLLSMGVDDIYRFAEKAGNIAKRIGFLIDYKSRLGVRSSNDRFKKYKTPVEKRVFDVLIASVALVVLSPLMLLISIIIKLGSKGSVLFVSQRVGAGYKIFNFYKFRSMKVDAEKSLSKLSGENQYLNDNNSMLINHAINTYDSTVLYNDEGQVNEYLYVEENQKASEVAFLKIKNDPRITKVGKFIRNTSIDELPQLINVLKGDMSIVGNRPLPLYEAEQLTTDQWSERFLAPAGLTGLWQVELRARNSQMSPNERKMLDIEYARTYSLKNDIKIIFRTIPALLQSQNV